MKHVIWACIVCACVAVAGCGQKGPLYLPDKNGSVVTRPAGSGSNTSQPSTPADSQGSKPKQQQDKSDDNSR